MKIATVCACAALAMGGNLMAPFSAADAKTLIRLGHSRAAEESLWLMDTPAGVTPNRGKAYEVKFIPFRSSSNRFKAYEAGELDCGTGPAATLIFAAANGVKFKAVASISKETSRGAVTGYYVLKDSPIKTIADLKGKTLALNGYKGGTELWVRAALKTAGLDADKDVRFALVRFSQMGNALRSKKVDLTIFVEPFTSFEEKKGGVRLLFTSRKGMPFDEDLQSMYCSEKFIAANRGAVKAFLADFVATTKYYLKNLKAARKALVKAKKVRVKGKVLMTLPDWYRDPNARLNVQDWGKLQDAMVSSGFMKASKKIDVKSIVDESLLPPAK